MAYRIKFNKAWGIIGSIYLGICLLLFCFLLLGFLISLSVDMVKELRSKEFTPKQTECYLHGNSNNGITVR